MFLVVPLMLTLNFMINFFPGTTSHAISNDPTVLANTKEDDDSSVTWIVVVTVICTLILFAIIAFLVYKWNKRYSGDFQIKNKEVGPSGTVVQYKDPGYKEKQLRSKV